MKETYYSDIKPKLSGWTWKQVDEWCDGSWDNPDSFDAAIKRNMALPHWTNTGQLWVAYHPSRIKLSESSENTTELRKQLFNEFASRCRYAIDSATIGDTVSLLHLQTLDIPGDKLYARLYGFTQPKKIVNIVELDTHKQLKFDDGSVYPQSDAVFMTDRMQSMNMTKLFANEEDCEKAVLWYNMRGNTNNKNLDFKINVDYGSTNVSEDSMSLRDWFGSGKHGGAGGGGWDRYNSSGERIGKCGDRKPGEAKPKCLSKSRAQSLRSSGGKKAIAAAVNKKRREDPNPDRRGSANMVSSKTKSGKKS